MTIRIYTLALIVGVLIAAIIPVALAIFGMPSSSPPTSLPGHAVEGGGPAVAKSFVAGRAAASSHLVTKQIQDRVPSDVKYPLEVVR